MRVVSIGECMVEFARREDGLWVQGFAGDTLNVAWALRALLPAAASVDYLTRVDRDPLSDRMVAMIADAGIGIAPIARDAARTVGLYTIETDDRGERSFSYWRGASAARQLASDDAALRAAIAGADLVYLSGITLAILPDEDRARLLAGLGVRGRRAFAVAFDPNIRARLWPDLGAAAAAVTAAAAVADILLPTHDDEAHAFGDADAAASLARYAAAGVPEIVVKDGARPTHWQAAGSRGIQAVPPVRDVVDTTGAGDSFNGAYLAGRLSGLDPAAAVVLAQRVAAAVIGRRGALIPARALQEAAGPGATGPGAP